YNILVIFDEIQCGMGRMGTLFAYEQFNLIPDVITIAKSLCGGVPIGACLTKGIANEVLTPGDHGSTYGGNPLVCAVGNAVLKELIDNNLIKNNVIEMGKYAKEKLENLRSKIDFIVEIRGKGLLLGIKLDSSKVLSKDFVAFALEKGLLLVGAGNNVVRYFPPFNVCKAEIDKSIKILEEVVGKF
ncbi:MAG: aminotransferase class III-fold pyridoxal phosphate-dependent enzyme, partial [Leptotrichiaceae bacterium]|nr:aminotransferase class III-fold pyridoxal phosphate-dependent enzyme [Leptotrichiaceae bacterium]